MATESVILNLYGDIGTAHVANPNWREEYAEYLKQREQVTQVCVSDLAAVASILSEIDILKGNNPALTALCEKAHLKIELMLGDFAKTVYSDA